MEFLALPVCLPGSEADNLPDKVAKLKILPTQIVAYNESYNDNQTMIFLANGQPFLIAMSMADLEATMLRYWVGVNEKSKLKIIN